MHLTTLLSGIQTVIECAKENGRSIAGVDICGEADAEAAHENESNDFANEKLLEVFDGLFGKRFDRLSLHNEVRRSPLACSFALEDISGSS